ncbi:MAG: ferrous iron transport protein B [Flavobacteriales bacterium]|nr:ferrous iron transport protein B [Flavobacteriales bacterium]MCW8912233.1 ferrous iron transport protein B [Flavobacteriales bacterium]MCW8936900.1 ferrous iron transport protein B [Flavobacteriales bacterium]MCW8968925.1 ferrous iron transport protein B [Flavobacteriales bacterium]MCW8990772.1 ferrous iron transport protein B [Flavobacteriales bacterium]
MTIKTIYLVGNPNTGKSSLFNALTGLSQKTGNFPGVTVDKKSGYTNINNQQIEVVDLPGTYSLNPEAEDERVAADIIKNINDDELIIVVADVTNLKRNLFLCTQIIDLGKPVVLVLNMMDLLQKSNQCIDLDKISTLLQIPVVPVNARIKKGINELKEIVANYQFRKASFLSDKLTPSERYEKITSVISACLQGGEANRWINRTKKIDNILTHKIYGYLIFLSILFVIFQAIFSWSAYPMELIEEGFAMLGGLVESWMPEGVLSDLIVNGILAGLSGIVVFVPQIALLFAFVTILEDTGYMSRVSFLMDRLLRPFGLNGKSIIPLISSIACAVPAIMSTRSITNLKERLITIMVSPLISCSARIPVYTLLIALVIPTEEQVGIFNLQGIVMMGLYLIGFLAALFAALVFKWILKSKGKSNFIMEMPIYRLPRWSNVGFSVYNKVKIFLFEAGKIIIAISIVLWGLSSYGPGDTFEKIEEKYTSPAYENENKDKINNLIASEKLEASYAAYLGKTIEPLIKPIGFDWKIGISLVTSFAAREVFVGTMATLYSVGDEDNTTSIREKMLQAKNPETGDRLYNKATTFSLLIFYAFAMQCMATLAVVYRETKSYKWPIIQVVYMGALAYVSSWIVYTIFS